MENDFVEPFMSSQASFLSDDKVQEMFEELQNFTQQGQYTQILERNAEVVFTEQGTDNTLDFEYEKYLLAEEPQISSLSDLFQLPKQEDNQHHQTFQQTANQVNGSNVYQQPTTSELPANNNWPGHLDFDISFDSKQEKRTKGSAWTYSESLDKLYVNIASPCPLRFHASSQPPDDAVIRIMPVFVKPAHVTDVVKRCILHSAVGDSTNIDFPYPDHLIRVESSKAEYLTDPDTGRHSVIVPYEKPHVGTDYIPFILKFMCLSSCSGTLCRRPIQVIFTLESRGQCIGRRTLPTKICRCPGRDRKTDEKSDKKPEKTGLLERTTSQEFYTINPAPKRTRFEVATQEDSNEEYTLKIKKREHFEILSKIYQSLELADKVTPEVAKEYYREKERNAEGSSRKFSRTIIQRNLSQEDAPPLQNLTSIPVITSDIKTEPESSLLCWLREINMEAYYDMFIENGIDDISQLHLISEEKLSNMGIGEGHRNIIWSSIQKFLSPLPTSRTISLSQGSQQSLFQSSQGSNAAKKRQFTVTRYKIFQHSTIEREHDYAQ